MRRPGFAEGAAVALALSLAAGAAGATVRTWLPPSLALGAIVTGVGLAYTLYLLSRGRVPTGRPTAIAIWVLVTGIVWLAAPPVSVHLLVQVGLAWLLRSVLFHPGPIAALADLGLWALGVMGAVWAGVETGSLFMSAWCLLLVQAAFTFIPAGERRDAGAPTAGDDRFEHAHRSAEAALRKLSATR